MKSALITGSTKGIGLEIARQLGQRGFHVWISGRNLDASGSALATLLKSGASAEFVELDVTDRNSVDTAYKTVSKTCKRIDVLMNNAAVLLDRNLKVLDVPLELADETLRINVLGVLQVTQIFSPLLKSGSRVVNVSSLLGQLSGGISDTAPMYCVSKAALNALTIQMNFAFQAHGVIVNTCSPGWVRTDMGGKNASLTVEEGADTPVWLATNSPADKSGLFWRERKVIPW